MIYIFYTILSLVLLVWVATKRRFTYWTPRGIYQIEPEFLFGNIKAMYLRTKSWAQCFREFHEHFKSKGLKYGGIYMIITPVLIVVDPELIKLIMLKDFDSFMNHGVYVNEIHEPLTGHIFNLEDQRWRKLRAKLTPTFTSGKIKMMFQTIVDITKGLKEVTDEYAVKGTPLNVKDICSRFTNATISSCAFGVECDSMKNPDSEFVLQGRKVVGVTVTDAFMQAAANALPLKLSEFLGIKTIRPDTEKFYMDIVRETVEYREKYNIHRNDFMHLLLQLKNQGELTDDGNILLDNDPKKESAITFNELAAQCFLFYIAGHETTSSTMTFTLLELAVNPDIQEKLRKEINTVLEKHENKITYEAIMEMKYLEMVVFESLRKYPPFPVILRQCTKPYTIPGTNLVIEKGTKVQFSLLGLHRDPEYYPEPDKFNPERFNEENKASRSICTWLPFGEGPRQCIGMRFGLLQGKVGLVTFIKNYKLSVNEKTKLPLELDPCNWLLSAKGDVWLNIESV